MTILQFKGFFSLRVRMTIQKRGEMIGHILVHEGFTRHGNEFFTPDASHLIKSICCDELRGISLEHPSGMKTYIAYTEIESILLGVGSIV